MPVFLRGVVCVTCIFGEFQSGASLGNYLRLCRPRVVYFQEEDANGVEAEGFHGGTGGRRRHIARQAVFQLAEGSVAAFRWLEATKSSGFSSPQDASQNVLKLTRVAGAYRCGRVPQGVPTAWTLGPKVQKELGVAAPASPRHAS